MASATKAPLGLDELQGRLLRLQDSPSFPDFTQRTVLDDSLREKERIEEELEELQAVKSSLFPAPHQADVSAQILVEQPAHQKRNGIEPSPGLEQREPESPIVVEQGYVNVRKEVDVMQQQMKVTCMEIISLKKAAAAKEEESRRLAEQHETELEALREQVRAAEQEKEHLRTTNHGYESLLRVEALEEELKDANQAIDVLENVRKELELDKSELEEYNRSIKSRKIEIEEAQELSKQEIDRLKNVVIEQSQEKLIMQKALTSKEEEISSLNNTVDTLKETVQSAVEDMKAALLRVEELQAVERALQSQVVELTATVEELRAKEEIAQQTIVELAHSNSTMNEQNQKLAAELPIKFQAQVDELQKDALEAKQVRDKQVRRLERRLEKRDEEIVRLRRVWRALLTSHPDINEAAEAAIEEVRELNEQVQRLEGQLAELQEQNENLTINVAITYIRLMLANWRRPMYLRMLEQRVVQAGEDEEELERLERIDAGLEERETADEEPDADEAQSPSGGDMEAAASTDYQSPPMTAFSSMSAHIPATSTSFRDASMTHSEADGDGLAPATCLVEMSMVTPRSEGDLPGIDPQRFKALQEGRAKYSASMPSHFATDSLNTAEQAVKEETEEEEAADPEELFPERDYAASVERSAAAHDEGNDEERDDEERAGEDQDEAAEDADDADRPPPSEADAAEPAPQTPRKPSLSTVPVVLPIIGKYQSPPSPRVNIDWGPVEAKIPSLPSSRRASQSPPQLLPLHQARRGSEDAKKDVVGAMEQLQRLKANAHEVREWAMAQMSKRQLEGDASMEGSPARTEGPLVARHQQSAAPNMATPLAQRGSPHHQPGYHPTGIKYTPSPPDIGMLEELTSTSAARSPARASPRPTHGWSAPGRPQQPASSSKPLTGPPREPRSGGPGAGGAGGGGWPGLSPDADLSKWVLGWLTPTTSPHDAKPRQQHGLSRSNLYPQDLYSASTTDAPLLPEQQIRTTPARDRPPQPGAEYAF